MQKSQDFKNTTWANHTYLTLIRKFTVKFDATARLYIKERRIIRYSNRPTCQIIYQGASNSAESWHIKFHRLDTTDNRSPQLLNYIQTNSLSSKEAELHEPNLRFRLEWRPKKCTINAVDREVRRTTGIKPGDLTFLNKSGLACKKSDILLFAVGKTK